MTRTYDKILTVKKLTIWEYACRHMMTHSKFPTLRQIKDNTSYSSISELHRPLQELVDLGLLDWNPRGGRQKYSIANGHWRPPQYYEDLMAGVLTGPEEAEIDPDYITNKVKFYYGDLE